MWVFVWWSALVVQVCGQWGPEPWQADGAPGAQHPDLPPDLRPPPAPRTARPGLHEWLYRRMLAVIVTGGQNQENEDGSVDVSLQMKFDSSQWRVLQDSMRSETPLSEDTLRSTLGYIQNSIYTPTVIEKIVMAWSDYVSFFLSEYKVYITWTLGCLAAAVLMLWLWTHMSHRHVIIIILLCFYAYEVIVSYKEAEQKELEKFLSAVERCRWYFWQSTCDVPKPDPIIFLKHMNPLKIAARMVTTALAEPVLAISGTLEVMLRGITDGLWYPFNSLAYIILTVVINISLIYFLLMVIFNWLLNIPFKLGFGLFGISINQRERTMFMNDTGPDRIQADRVSQATIDKILDVCTLALSNNAQSSRSSRKQDSNSKCIGNVPALRRCASTGRLPNTALGANTATWTREASRSRHDGSGDA